MTQEVRDATFAVQTDGKVEWYGVFESYTEDWIAFFETEPMAEMWARAQNSHYLEVRRLTLIEAIAALLHHHHQNENPFGRPQ